MTLLSITYLIYLTVTFYVTVIVGHRLHLHGRPFLVECFSGRVELAEAVNQLLLVGYYLTNCALATLLLYSGLRPENWLAAIELLSEKLGQVLLILGAMHFLNVVTALAIRSRRRRPSISQNI